VRIRLRLGKGERRASADRTKPRSIATDAVVDLALS
jgi:hypothetical protein